MSNYNRVVALEMVKGGKRIFCCCLALKLTHSRPAFHSDRDSALNTRGAVREEDT